MADFYGVRVTEESTSVSDPVTVDSGITLAIGTAPIHQVGGEANQVVIAYSYAEAVSALGYSDDWEKYTLCEVMYTHFKLYGVAPVIFINVLDPDDYTESGAGGTYTVSNGQVTLDDLDALPDTIVVKNGNTTYEAGTDYDVFYSDGVCVIEQLSGGQMETDSPATVTVECSVVNFAAANLASAVIGGYNTETGKSTGMELIDAAYFKGLVLPDIFIAPGFSQDATVAAALAAKAQSFSTVFTAIAICDLDTETNTSYQAAATAKQASQSYCQTKQVICWPMVALGDMIFHMSSHLAALMGTVDAENDNIPSEAASNKVMQADSAVLADGTEVLLDLTAANYLRGQGMVTAYNFVNGFTSWGAYCACYPNSTDPKDMFIPVSRMFNYVRNNLVLTYWSRIDERMTPRYAASIADEVNIWLNSLVADGHLLGGRCEYLESENSDADLAAGIIHLHVYITPPTPAQEIDFVMEYDVSYVSSVLGTSAS